VENICVTDRQENGIKTSLDNMYAYLSDGDNGLAVIRNFTNGSYDRDTIIRPLDDIDIFSVLNREGWEDEYKQLPKPQDVLSKFKKYLNGIAIYEGKVRQDRPCVTIRLSDKNFDIMPSFEQLGGGYLIPNFDLSGWTYTYPEQLYDNLEAVHKQCNYKVKQIIKAVKHWNRGLDKLIPSYHIEEVAINIFILNDFKNYREGIELWFKNAEYYLLSNKFKSNNDYLSAIEHIKKVIKKFDEAGAKYADDKEPEAVQLWKEIFGKEFPTIDPAEAKNFARSISEGTLKVASTGALSNTAGYAIGASKGYHGGLSED
jgi:tetratricopeptide (TPR) repeat protein